MDACGAAAIAGSLAAALGKLVCNLMIEQKKIAQRRGARRSGQTRSNSAMIWRRILENQGRNGGRSLALPRGTEAGRLARTMALEQATKNAVGAPLRIARNSMEVLDCLTN